MRNLMNFITLTVSVYFFLVLATYIKCDILTDLYDKYKQQNTNPMPFQQWMTSSIGEEAIGQAGQQNWETCQKNPDCAKQTYQSMYNNGDCVPIAYLEKIQIK